MFLCQGFFSLFNSSQLEANKTNAKCYFFIESWARYNRDKYTTDLPGSTCPSLCTVQRADIAIILSVLWHLPLLIRTEDRDPMVAIMFMFYHIPRSKTSQFRQADSAYLSVLDTHTHAHRTLKRQCVFSNSKKTSNFSRNLLGSLKPLDS